MEKPISFLAAFPAIQSAIKIYGDRQGMRIQLDIPESEMGEALLLLQWREKVLRVTVSPDIQEGNRNGRKADGLEARTKRQSKWQAAERESTDGDS